MGCGSWKVQEQEDHVLDPGGSVNVGEAGQKQERCSRYL